MADRHLNLFYAYGGHDGVGNLIEDNLTRAFIKTVRMLSPERREAFLKDLFGRARPLMFVDRTHPAPPPKPIPCVSFAEADVALQDHIPRKHDPRHRKYEHKRVVTISSGAQPMKRNRGSGQSIPDAWIYDCSTASFCFLVESKYRDDNPIETGQILRHGDWLGKNWRGSDWDECVAPDLLDLTWYDVLEAIETANVGPDAGLDRKVFDELAQYIGYYGYRSFRGLDFTSLTMPPEWQIVQP